MVVDDFEDVEIVDRESAALEDWARKTTDFVDEEVSAGVCSRTLQQCGLCSGLASEPAAQQHYWPFGLCNAMFMCRM